MAITVEAIYEQEVSVIIKPQTTRLQPEAEKSPAEILAAIVVMPPESSQNGFSGRDHDQVLYTE